MEEMHLERIAESKDVPEGGVRVFDHEGESIAICRDNGEIFALQNLCSHDDSPLGEGELADGELECPRHGARFDIKTGEARCLPAVTGIATFEVREENGFIFLIDRKAKREIQA